MGILADGERDAAGGATGVPVAPAAVVGPALVPGAVARVRRPTGWWVAPLYLGMAVVLVPWVVLLARTLPDRAMSANYRLAWVGFDVLLVAAMLRTAWQAWRRSPFVVNVASATATLLVVDAWFDVTTAPTREDLMSSVALAVGVELPAAVLSLVIAGRAQLTLVRTGVRARTLLDRFGWIEAPDPAASGQDSTSRVVNRAQASEPNTTT